MAGSRQVSSRQMLDEDLEADAEERDTSGDLGELTEPGTDQPPEQGAAGGEDKSCETDGDGDDDDVHMEHRQRHADRHGVKAGGDRRRHKPCE